MAMARTIFFIKTFNVFRWRMSMRNFLLCILFVSIILTSSHVAVRELSQTEEESLLKDEQRITERVASSSGATQIKCVARQAPQKYPYNYSFSSPSKGIRGRQWCCLTPNMRDIVKVKSAPKKGSHGATSATSISTTPYEGHETQNLNSTIITGKDGSEWRVPLVEKWSWKCLPNFIVAGTQKSGSTALSAYLLAHPQVSMGRSKEVHFFDKPIPLGLLPYLINFASVDGTSGMGLLDEKALSEFANLYMQSKKSGEEGAVLPYAPPFITGEATPFYIADRDACKNIQEQLPEVPALIVLVRDPVSRVYSEYMMKKRRVESQDQFLEILDRNAWQLLRCLTRSLNLPMGSYRNTSAHHSTHVSMDGCVPAELTAHAKWKDLKKALREMTKSTSSTSASPPNPLDTILKCFYTETPWEVASDIAPVSSVLPRGTFSSQVNISWTKPKYYLKKQALSDVSFITTANSKEAYVLFDVKGCVPRGLKEHFPSTDIFLKEIDDFVKCAGVEYNSGMGVEALDAAVGRCVKVHHGISDQFIYRSMYAAQLYHCFKSIPEEKVLVLDSEQLKSHPAEVLRQVHQHLGISDFDYPTILHGEGSSKDIAEKLQKVFDEFYPSFEERTGWRMDGEYEPISKELKEVLAKFFKPHNAHLELLVGKHFNW